MVVAQTAAMVVAPTVREATKPIAVQTREAWAFEVFDEAQVPREF